MVYLLFFKTHKPAPDTYSTQPPLTILEHEQLPRVVVWRTVPNVTCKADQTHTCAVALTAPPRAHTQRCCLNPFGVPRNEAGRSQGHQRRREGLCMGGPEQSASPRSWQRRLQSDSNDFLK